MIKGGLKPVPISVRGIDRDSFEEVLLLFEVGRIYEVFHRVSDAGTTLFKVQIFG